MTSAPHRTRFRPLLLALVVMLLLHPILLELGYARLLNLAWVGVLALAIYCTGNLPRRPSRAWWMAIVLLLALPSLCLRLAMFSMVDTRGILLLASSSIAPIFLTVVAFVVMRSVLSAGTVTGEKIYGAVSVYLLLGLIWSSLYAVVELLFPGSFHTPSGAMLVSEKGATAVLPGSEAGFLYYSFTTLTTLGYGDIVPAAPLAQTLAWMEAATGQLFLAVTIARLVGLSITSPPPSSEPPESIP